MKKKKEMQPDQRRCDQEGDQPDMPRSGKIFRGCRHRRGKIRVLADCVMHGHWTKSRRQIQINLPDSVDPSARLRENFAMACPHPILILPFVLLLGAMALAPVLCPRWWAKHYPKVALGLGAVTAGIYFFFRHDTASLCHAAHEYISFVALVGSLFVVAGGIQIRLPRGATPLANVGFLFIGAVAANFLGTTGAAMLLIRPWIHINQGRIAAHHIAFFIFLVANVGGCLTPIGDPPLFLGFLQGIPFWWVAQKCWPMWAAGTGLLLGIFYVVDKINFSRTPKILRENGTGAGDWRFAGLPNLFFLAVILGAVLVNRPPFLREGLMLAAAAGSYFTTKKEVHAANEFDFHPAIEVAVLFAGIFATMIPALAWLDHNASTLLGNNPSPGIFYWSTGGLSAVLDNAPTYLGFLSTLFGVTGARHIADLLDQNTAHVLAISIGAVFFGAATYIGNGPNFMVKAIAEQRGVRVPTFLEFVWKFSLPFLLPVLITVWLLFFRG
jgi:Na+/H+ antiporter NhaD/arsenite permease-like protein